MSTQRDTIVVENFYDRPDLIRAYAINQLTNNYYDAYPRTKGPTNGPIWITSKWRNAKNCPFKSSKELIKKLEFYTGEKIDMHQWNADFPLDWPIYEDHPKREEYAQKAYRGEISCKWNCSFHLKLPVKDNNIQQKSVHTHNRVLWDDVGQYGWAGLVYINYNMAPGGGMYTWRNLLGNDERYMTDEKEWEMEDRFSPVFNRLILIRGKKPHSGADGWSTDPESGRIFQTFFFRTLPTFTSPVKIFNV